MNEGLHTLGLDDLKRSWGWFLGLGIVLIVLGTIALGSSVLLTLASMVLFGCVLLAGGSLAIAHAFLRKRWGGFFLDLVIGILYDAAGFFLVVHPGEAAITLTLFIAFFLMMGGVLRILVALTVPLHHRGWLLLNGVITLLLGIMIWRQWPVSGLWVIGLFVGIDMIFYGWSLVMLGLTAKNLPEQA